MTIKEKAVHAAYKELSRWIALKVGELRKGDTTGMQNDLAEVIPLMDELRTAALAECAPAAPPETTEPTGGCGYTGREFGADYPDSTCIAGRLWGLDSCDEPGGPLRNGGTIRCPQCNSLPSTPSALSPLAQAIRDDRLRNRKPAAPSAPSPSDVEQAKAEPIFAAVYALAERCCKLGPSGGDERWQTTREWAAVVKVIEAALSASRPQPSDVLARPETPREAFIKGYIAGRLDNDTETVELQHQRRRDAEQEAEIRYGKGSSHV